MIEEEKKPFEIETPDQASWAMRKLREIQGLRDQNERLAHDEIEHVNDWLDKENKKTDQSKDYFENLLTEYAFKMKANDPKWKLETPNGRLSIQKTRPKYIYDEEKLTDQLKGTDFIKEKYQVDKTKLKQAVEFTPTGKAVIAETGQMIEGISTEPAGEKARIKLTEE